MSNWILFENNRESNPPSHSAERSGLRFGLPSWLYVSMGESVPLMLADDAENVFCASFAPGCTPEAPYAKRSRRLLTAPKPIVRGKKFSSEITHEPCSFG